MNNSRCYNRKDKSKTLPGTRESMFCCATRFSWRIQTYGEYYPKHYILPHNWWLEIQHGVLLEVDKDQKVSCS